MNPSFFPHRRSTWFSIFFKSSRRQFSSSVFWSVFFSACGQWAQSRAPKSFPVSLFHTLAGMTFLNGITMGLILRAIFCLIPGGHLIPAAPWRMIFPLKSGCAFRNLVITRHPKECPISVGFFQRSFVSSSSSHLAYWVVFQPSSGGMSDFPNPGRSMATTVASNFLTNLGANSAQLSAVPPHPCRQIILVRPVPCLMMLVRMPAMFLNWDFIVGYFCRFLRKSEFF